MNWTYDTEGARWMVFDEDEPDTAPVVCREVRTEEMAKLISAAPAMQTALIELIEVVKVEVNQEGGSGYLLARLTDAKNALAKSM